MPCVIKLRSSVSKVGSHNVKIQSGHWTEEADIYILIEERKGVMLITYRGGIED
jgi:hypothetical protein